MIDKARELMNASQLLREEYLENEFFRDAVIASVKSALRETTIVWEEWEYEDAARKIAERIFLG